MLDILKQVNELGWVISGIATFVGSMVILFYRVRILEKHNDKVESDLKGVSLKINKYADETREDIREISNMLHKVLGRIDV
jgi:hypothetical protein